MDTIETADEGGFRVNSGIGVGKTISNIWGSYGKPNVAIFNSSNLYSVLYYVFNYVFNIQLVFNIQHDI